MCYPYDKEITLLMLTFTASVAEVSERTDFIFLSVYFDTTNCFRKMKYNSLSIYFTLFVHIFAEKINLDTLNNYSEFLNYGDKKLNKLEKSSLENSIFKSKIDIIGEIFKKNIDALKQSGNLDILFLVDGSSSVGDNNFKSELKFVKKLLSDITVDYNHTRVAIVTFSSSNNIIRNIDEISQPSKINNKCLLLNKELNNVTYHGGETYTLGAFETAKEIFENTRNNSKKVLFLITDGYSNGGNPVPLANELKEKQIVIFTIGIQNGNYKELYELSSQPGEFYSYLLDSFEEFESLARRALHVDLKIGDYIPLGFNSPCNSLCDEGDCCDKNALCSCGTTTGHYSCICQPGYYGSGLKNSCLPCIPGTYSSGPNLCLPCPDIHHTTTPPAFNIESCKCKIGYQAAKNNQCKILKCPKIPIPSHGYLVKKRECGNVLNSACGVRCEVGYTLVGNSIRLCQANATWSGSEPSCEVKTCTQLTVPKYGTMSCSQTDIGVTYDKETNLPVDTVCTFKCSKGKTLIGSSQRTCLPLARWDGLKSTCKQIKCNKLPMVKFGTIEPISCTIGKQEYGKKCVIKCQEGFKIGGPAEKRCEGDHGSWNSKFEETTCTDVTPPKLSCPENITSHTETGKKFGYVYWKPLEVSDNSELEVSIWMKPVIKNLTDFKFEIGATSVTYFAQDAFHNKAKCTFYVIINDLEPPTIENCESPPIFLTNNKKGENVSWDEPHIFDNSQQVNIHKSHQFGFFKLGTTTVTYTGKDNFNNTNVCKINITIEEAHCEALSDPLYGMSNCNPRDDGMQCVITCQEGYAIPLAQPQIDNSSINFMCNHSEPVWYNQDGLLAPECSVTKVPEEVEQDGEININTDLDVCNDTQKLNELRNDIKNNLEKNVCLGANCTINTQEDCDLERTEEITNRIKRNTIYEAIPHKNKTKRTRKKLNVKFQVRGKYINENNTNIDSWKTKPGHNFTVQYHKPKFFCPLGFVPRKNRCVQCPKGTFHNVTANKCQSCSFGSYSDQLGQTECVRCRLHFSTRKMHSKKAEECKEQCPPGTHARKKTMRRSKHHPNVTVERATLKPFCHSCDIGYYQSDYGQLNCLPCPIGYTTTAFGTYSKTQCIPTAKQICTTVPKLCNNGTCIATSDYHYHCNCHENYYGTHCEKLLSSCDSQPCLNGGICTVHPNSNQLGLYSCECRTGFTGRFCEEVQEECHLNCLNNGRCIQSDVNEYMCLCPDGFGGDYCEVSLKICTGQLCENNSTCIDEKNTFRCICSKGFIGRRCNILPCDYRPCRDNFNCVNTMEENSTKHSYQCVCSEGYTGKDCTEKIDYCKGNPCLNGGKCVNNLTNYTCECTDLFHGVMCEVKRRTNYILHFPKYDTLDYVKLPGFISNLTEISTCLWMQTTDNFNYGTLLSYATRIYDNAFTLTDYTGLVLYVNNQYVVTDVLLNDGYWHHICVSWTSLGGQYVIVVDGKQIKNGSGLASSSYIEGFGNMIIGQEQDIIGGKFSLSESFMGKMAYVDVWSKTLTENEMSEHLNDCNGTVFGNLYPWPKMLDHLYGSIKIINSTFCNKCEVPRTLYNGFIDVVDNIAYYSCYKGYELNNLEYLKGRRCTKASKWEGMYEPYCKKIHCGYPGYVKNGYLIGNKYYYQDKISYGCHEGYSLQGNGTIVCRADGIWYPEKPRCLGAQCIAFLKPESSNITVMSDQSYEDFVENKTLFDVGTQIEINCDENTELEGENILTCLEDGKWDLNPPVCTSNKHSVEHDNETPKKLDCAIDQIPNPPPNGYIDIETFYAVGNGTSNLVEYKCRTGYKLHGDNVSTCIIDGYWTVPNISCDSTQCNKPPKIKNTILKRELENEIYQFGNMLTYDCAEGYRMFGNNIIRCLANGRWTRLQGKCTKKSCHKPSMADVTILSGNSYLFEDEVTLICPNQQQYILKCNKDGIWEGDRDETC